MDFFDAQKQKEHAIRLAVGYAVIGAVLIFATTILLYRAYGFGLDRNGKVIQNGLVFASSLPDKAAVLLNGKKYKDATNTRMDVPAGPYVVQLQRDGYREWKRAVTVEGGRVARFDYPFLFPNTLATTVTKQYAAAPGLATNSPDHRWLLVATPEQNVFDLFDLNTAKPIARQLALPSDILAAGSTTRSWELVDWARDNRHVLLRRQYEKPGQPGAEYILLDREDAALSQNLSVTLGFAPAVIELRGGAYDDYYAFDPASGQVFTADLRRPTPQPYLSNIAAFASDDDTVLYVTATDAPPGKALVRMQRGQDAAHTVRQLPAGTVYLLAMERYNNQLLVAAGAQSEGRVSVYRNPLAKLEDNPQQVVTPVQILKVAAPSYVSFSANKRFVMAENGDRFAVYDAETDRGYAYQAKAPPDTPQTHAMWMDGFRLAYVSGGKLAVMDYDGTNWQDLVPASAVHLPAFDRNYRFLYTVSAQNALTSTALRTPKDL